jgi:asparagine synthase (glutamine-hydrolysing)
MSLRYLLERAVAEQVGLGADAVLLSGGIDSSTIAMLAPDLPLVTGWYEGEAYDERPWAREVAYGRPWLQVEITPDDFVWAVDKTIAALGGLPCGPGAVGQYVVAQAVSKTGYNILLSGEGGDELFGGYARQYLAAGLDPPDGYEDYRLPDGYPATLEEALALEWEALRTLCKVDDRVAGAHGVTVIPPMLDPWVVAWAHSQPAELRIGKQLLKDAMRGLVPDEILDRTDKRGFPVPFVCWAQGPLKEWFLDRLGYVPDPAKPWDRGWWNDLRSL